MAVLPGMAWRILVLIQLGGYVRAQEAVAAWIADAEQGIALLDLWPIEEALIGLIHRPCRTWAAQVLQAPARHEKGRSMPAASAASRMYCSLLQGKEPAASSVMVWLAMAGGAIR